MSSITGPSRTDTVALGRDEEDQLGDDGRGEVVDGGRERGDTTEERKVVGTLKPNSTIYDGDVLDSFSANRRIQTETRSRKGEERNAPLISSTKGVRLETRDLERRLPDDTREDVDDLDDHFTFTTIQVLDGVLSFTTETTVRTDRGGKGGWVTEVTDTTFSGESVRKEVKLDRTEVRRKVTRKETKVGVNLWYKVITVGETTFLKFMEEVGVDDVNVRTDDDTLIKDLPSLGGRTLFKGRGVKSGLIVTPTQHQADEVFSSSLDVIRYTHRVPQPLPKGNFTYPVPFGEVRLFHQISHRPGPGISERGGWGGDTVGHDEVGINVGRTMETNEHVPSLSTNDPFPFVVVVGVEGEGIEFDEVREFGSDKDIEGKDTIGVGEFSRSGEKTRRPINQLRNGFVEDIISGDVPTNHNTEVLIPIRSPDTLPGGVREETRINLTTGGKDSSFILVNPKARGDPKVIDQIHDGPNVLKFVSGHSQIVGTGVRGGGGKVVDALKENVVTNDEQERREGTTLFDPPVDGNPPVFNTGKGWSNPTVDQKVFDNVTEPRWETRTIHRFMNEDVIYRVKGFGGVHEQQPTVLTPFFGSPIKTFIKSSYMIFETPTLKKTFLGVMEGM